MTPRSRSITVPSRITKTKKQRVLEFAASQGWERIGEAEWIALRAAMPDVSVGVIQKAGLPVDAPWCGVHQHTFAELEASLLEFSRVYEARTDLRDQCRQQVIAAKDRARWLSVKAADEETRGRKAEMVEWMLVWLSDPALFPAWLNALHALHAVRPPAE